VILNHADDRIKSLNRCPNLWCGKAYLYLGSLNRHLIKCRDLKEHDNNDTIVVESKHKFTAEAGNVDDDRALSLYGNSQPSSSTSDERALDDAQAITVSSGDVEPPAAAAAVDAVAVDGDGAILINSSNEKLKKCVKMSQLERRRAGANVSQPTALTMDVEQAYAQKRRVIPSHSQEWMTRANLYYEQLARDFLLCYPDMVNFSVYDNELVNALAAECHRRLDGDQCGAYELRAIAALVMDVQFGNCSLPFRLVKTVESLIAGWPSQFTWDQTIIIFAMSALLQKDYGVAADHCVIMISYYLTRMDSEIRVHGGWGGFLQHYGYV